MRPDEEGIREADLPAQAAEAQANPRVPCAHADTRGAERAQAEAAEGPQAPHGVGKTPCRRLSPWPALRNRREFQAVYGEGRRHAGTCVVVYRRVRPGPVRVGISVGRSVGKAVVRNRLRRRIREILRLCALRPNQDVVVVARRQAAQASWEALRGELRALLEGSGALEPAVERRSCGS